MLQLSGDKGISCSRLWLEELGRSPSGNPMGSSLNPRAHLEMLNPGLFLLAALGTDALHLHNALHIHVSGMGGTNTELSTPGWVWTFTKHLHLQARRPARVEHPPSLLLMQSLGARVRRREDLMGQIPGEGQGALSAGSSPRAAEAFPVRSHWLKCTDRLWKRTF